MEEPQPQKENDMIFVWITSYLFAVVLGGVLTLCAIFVFFSPERRDRRALKRFYQDNPEVAPLGEPHIPAADSPQPAA